MEYKNIAILFLLAIALAAAGCGSKGTAPGTATSGASGGAAPADAGVQASQQITPTASYDLSQEEESKALKMLDAGVKTTISTPYIKQGLNVGDAYVVGLGIMNVFPKENNFRIIIHFREAKTTGGLATLIEGTDEEVMLNWLNKNKFSNIKLAQNSKKVVPLIVEVKPEMGPGKNTIPASYVFDIDVQYESNPQFWEEYTTQTLTVKVI